MLIAATGTPSASQDTHTNSYFAAGGTHVVNVPTDMVYVIMHTYIQSALLSEHWSCVRRWFPAGCKPALFAATALTIMR